MRGHSGAVILQRLCNCRLEDFFLGIPPLVSLFLQNVNVVAKSVLSLPVLLSHNLKDYSHHSTLSKLMQSYQVRRFDFYLLRTVDFGC